MKNIINIIDQTLSVLYDAYRILFPKTIKRVYNRNRLGQFSIKSQPITWINDEWKASL